MEARLNDRLRTMESGGSAEPHVDDSDQLDEETKEALRSLGYLE